MSGIAYDADFYGWANEQAALLRAGRLADGLNFAQSGGCDALPEARLISGADR